MVNLDEIRNLPDGSLTKEEVNDIADEVVMLRQVFRGGIEVWPIDRFPELWDALKAYREYMGEEVFQKEYRRIK